MYEHQCPGDHSDCALWGSCPQLSPCCMCGELSRKAGCENVNSQSAGDMDIQASQNQAFSALSLVGRGTHRHRLLDAWGLVGAMGETLQPPPAGPTALACLDFSSGSHCALLKDRETAWKTITPTGPASSPGAVNTHSATRLWRNMLWYPSPFSFQDVNSASDISLVSNRVERTGASVSVVTCYVPRRSVPIWVSLSHSKFFWLGKQRNFLDRLGSPFLSGISGDFSLFQYCQICRWDFACRFLVKKCNMLCCIRNGS